MEEEDYFLLLLSLLFSSSIAVIKERESEFSSLYNQGVNFLCCLFPQSQQPRKEDPPPSLVFSSPVVVIKEVGHSSLSLLAYFLDSGNQEKGSSCFFLCWSPLPWLWHSWKENYSPSFPSSSLATVTKEGELILLHCPLPPFSVVFFLDCDDWQRRILLLCFVLCYHPPWSGK